MYMYTFAVSLYFFIFRIARSKASSFGMQAAPSSICMSGTFFRGDLVMKNISTAILPLPLFQEEQLSVTGKRMCTKNW